MANRDHDGASSRSASGDPDPAQGPDGQASGGLRTPRSPTESEAPFRERAHAEPGADAKLAGLVGVMDRLLDPQHGCPWDQAQTLGSLRQYLLEESFEVLAVMDQGTGHGAPPSASAQHCDELGDLLFQIVFQSALRERMKHFALGDVLDGITAKLIRRHPHVFALAQPESKTAPASWTSAIKTEVAEVEASWNTIKAQEAVAAGASRRSQDIGRGLPPLLRSEKIQAHAAHLGFDWPDVNGVLLKVREELGELETEICSEATARAPRSEAVSDPDLATRSLPSLAKAALAEEFGDLLFALVRLAGHLGLGAELCLADANEKFARRFDAVLKLCEADGVEPAQAGLPRLDSYWRAVKASEPRS